MSKGLMVRWCGMRLDGKHMTTVGVPFKGKVELRGARELRCALVVSQREVGESVQCSVFGVQMALTGEVAHEGKGMSYE